ncbi:MAG: hypothetical protein PHV16_03920 [Candidatus Nanoarchaeia archaeon]|nr:hypothetical protein [Candidatus Nanoarchaeia archaeon]
MGSKKEELDFEKEYIVDMFQRVPKRRLSEVEKQLIFILIEKSKLQRERSMSLLNKGFMTFIAFLVVAYLSKIGNLVSPVYTNILFVFGIVVLVVVTLTYITTLAREEKILNNLLNSFLK